MLLGLRDLRDVEEVTAVILLFRQIQQTPCQESFVPFQAAFEVDRMRLGRSVDGRGEML